LRYGRSTPWLEAFLGSSGSIRAVWGCPRPFPSPLGDTVRTDLPIRTPYRLGGLAPPDLPPCVPPSLITVGCGTGLFTRCPSPAPRGCGLGPPHPQLISMAAEPSGIRWERFSLSSRYSCRHSLSTPLQVTFPFPFSADVDAPLPLFAQSAASVPDLAPVDCRRHGTIDQ
jgi:hypothetical protein